MKLLLFTILLISSTCLRLKFGKKYVSYMVQFLRECCKYRQPNIFLEFTIAYFICDPSELIGMWCACNNNCKYGTCQNGICVTKSENATCTSHVECNPLRYMYCVNGTCHDFSK